MGHMDYSDEPCHVTENARISIRILVRSTLSYHVSAVCDSAFLLQWPGYDEWKFVNMAVRDSTKDKKPYSRGQVAHKLADVIKKFCDVKPLYVPKCDDVLIDHLQEMKFNLPTRGVDPKWCLQNIRLDRLYMAELRHVSQGTWQPVLYYDFP